MFSTTDQATSNITHHDKNDWVDMVEEVKVYQFNAPNFEQSHSSLFNPLSTDEGTYQAGGSSPLLGNSMGTWEGLPL